MKEKSNIAYDQSSESSISNHLSCEAQKPSPIATDCNVSSSQALKLKRKFQLENEHSISTSCDEEILQNASIRSTPKLNIKKVLDYSEACEFVANFVSSWVDEGTRFKDESFGPSRNIDESEKKISKVDAVTCFCMELASRKKVYKTGPNEGRFFLSCSNRLCNFFSWAADVPFHSQNEQPKWKEFYLKRFKLSSKLGGDFSFSSDDVLQGSVGDCWFLAGLSVIAEKSQLIKKVIKTNEIEDQAGIYHIQLFLNGKWNSVVVDCWFPYKPKSKSATRNSSLKWHDEYQLAFAKGQKNKLWPSLIEKAFAKACGSYASISGGHISEAFTILTGAPTECIYMNSTTFNSEEIWLKLISYSTSEFLMGCSTSWNGSTGKCGLVSQHAYSILEVKEIYDCIEGQQPKIDSFFRNKANSHLNSSNNSTLRLLRIRNPWGRYEWNKDWSAKSDQWTVKLRRELKRGDPNDGTFWMSYHDFIQYFTSIDVCKVRSDWFYQYNESVTIRSQRPSYHSSNNLFTCPYAYKVKTVGHANTWTYISLWQPSKRGQQGPYWYSSISLLILLKVGKIYVPVKSVYSYPKEHLQIELFLKPDSEYKVIPFPIGITAKVKFTIGYYSSQPLDICPSSFIQSIDSVRLCLYQSVDEFYKKQNRTTQNFSLLEDSYLFVTEGSGGVVFFDIINMKKDRYMLVQLRLLQYKNYAIEGTKNTFLKLDPFKRTIAMILIPVIPTEKCSFNFEYCAYAEVGSVSASEYSSPYCGAADISMCIGDYIEKTKCSSLPRASKGVIARLHDESFALDNLGSLGRHHKFLH